MNKKIIIILVVALLLISGVVLFKGQKMGDNDNKEISKGTSKNVFTSIKDALSKDLTLTCEFNDEKGNTTKSYIKNGAVRISTIGSDTKGGEIIMRDKKMYMWDEITKEGFIYEIPDEEKGNVGMTGQDINQSEAYLNIIDKYKDSCKTAVIEDSYFVEPKGINFQDMSKLLQDIKNQVPNFPQQ